MEDGKPSQTALMVAALRADHYLNAPEPKILRDSVALTLSGLQNPDGVAAYIDNVLKAFAALSNPETAAQFLRSISDAVCMRSRLVEGQLNTPRSAPLSQLVILGAGLDSLAYRDADLTKGLQIFEVDHPATQAWKREQLIHAGIAIPENLQFVSFDFEKQTLSQALDHGGVNRQAVTLFTWLGVHMYLTDETVKATLAVLGTFPKGSEIVMDFIMPDYGSHEDLIPDSIDYLTQVVAKMGEPVKSQYTQSELEDRLNTAGFNDVTFWKSSELIDRFLDGDESAYSLTDQASNLASARI